MNIIKTNNLSLNFIATCGLVEVKLKLDNVELGNIIRHNLMKRCELPDPCFELGGLIRTVKSRIAGLEFVLAFTEELIPWCFQITQKNPIVFITSRKQALQYKRILEYTKTTASIKPIKGTLSGGPPITFFDENTGGSKNEQIAIMQWHGP